MIGKIIFNYKILDKLGMKKDGKSLAESVSKFHKN